MNHSDLYYTILCYAILYYTILFCIVTTICLCLYMYMYMCCQEIALEIFWKYVKPDGYYLIEDVTVSKPFPATTTASLEGGDFQMHPEYLKPFTQNVLRDNHVFYVDSHVGHRRWEEFKSKTAATSSFDHRYHNSNVLAIRKRVGPPPPVHINAGGVAMKASAIVNASSATDDDHVNNNNDSNNSTSS